MSGRRKRPRRDSVAGPQQGKAPGHSRAEELTAARRRAAVAKGLFGAAAAITFGTAALFARHSYPAMPRARPSLWARRRDSSRSSGRTCCRPGWSRRRRRLRTPPPACHEPPRVLRDGYGRDRRRGSSPAHVEAIEGLFRERERTFSRFIDGSELNRVNASAGRLVPVSRVFAETLRVALRAAAETDGLVVPTVGAALAAAGYTRTSRCWTPTPAGRRSPPRGRRLGRVLGRLVRVAPGVRLDLNGVVKSRTVDEALALLPAPGFVSAGGDLAAHGEMTVALPVGGVVSLAPGRARDQRDGQAELGPRRGRCSTT